MNKDIPSGIAAFDNNGTEPIGAALSVGCKGKNGAPTDKDRFYVVLPRARWAQFQTNSGKSYNAQVRDGHPSFAKFNAELDVTRRQVIPAILTHLTVPEAFRYNYFGLELPGHNPPKRPGMAPMCVGDGRRALRYMGERQGCVEIPCPGEQCQYRQKAEVNGKVGKAPCGPHTILFARFNWPRVDGKGLPNLPFKFVSSSKYTTKNFIGFFDAFKTACIGLGVDPSAVPLFGLPVTLTLQEQGGKIGNQTTSFPVVSLSVAGDLDLLAWVQFQLQRGADIRQLAAARPVPALTDRTVIDGVLTEDSDLVSGPLNIPGGM